MAVIIIELRTNIRAMRQHCVQRLGVCCELEIETESLSTDTKLRKS